MDAHGHLSEYFLLGSMIVVGIAAIALILYLYWDFKFSSPYDTKSDGSLAGMQRELDYLKKQLSKESRRKNVKPGRILKLTKDITLLNRAILIKMNRIANG